MNYREDQRETESEVGSQSPVGLRLPRLAEYVTLTRLVVSSVGESAGFDSEDVYDLKLAVTEAVTNVIRHTSVESLQVDYRSLPGIVEVKVTDTGGGFDVGEFEREPGENGGFGIAVIRSLVDELDLESTKHGTVVKMTRSVSGPDS